MLWNGSCKLAFLPYLRLQISQVLFFFTAVENQGSSLSLTEIQVIRCALKLLESLEAEMVPAIYSCYMDPTNKAANRHLQFLWRSFREHCEHMQASLDSVADPVAFCHVKLHYIFLFVDFIHLCYLLGC